MNNQNKETPIISIVIPVYNVECYIKECLESVQEQTFTNWEAIIVDDGSTDNSFEQAKIFVEKDSRFKIFKKPNGGLSDARNFGIDKTSGQYIFLLDSDDYLPKNALENLYGQINSPDDKIIVGAHSILKNGKCFYKGIGIGKTKELSQEDALKEIMLDKEVDLSAWAKLYRKDLFDSICYPVGLNFEDTATTYKLFMQCEKISVCGESVYFYRIRNNSITTTIDFSKKLQLIENTKSMCESILKVYPQLSDYANRRMVWAYFSTLNQLLKSKNKNEYIEQQRDIVNFLLKNKSVIKNQACYGKKERLAITLLSMGLPIYNFARFISEHL